jgi:hypothetical protein
VKLWCRAADSNAIKAAVLGILRRICASPSLYSGKYADQHSLEVSIMHNRVRNTRLPDRHKPPRINSTHRRAPF